MSSTSSVREKILQSTKPILFGSLLSSEGTITLQNVPQLQDIDTTINLISQLGVRTEQKTNHRVRETKD